MISTRPLDDPKIEAVHVFTMDSSKAFDSIKQKLLSERLKRAFLNPKIINWLIDILSHRKQRFVHNNVVTEWKCVNRGTANVSVKLMAFIFSGFS